MSLWCDFMAGWISGMGGLIVGHPMDSIKVNQQINGTALVQAMKDGYRTRGLTGFYRGMSTPLLSNGALNSLYFGFYTSTLDFFRDRKANEYRNVGLHKGNKVPDVPTYTEHFVAGCVGGCAQLVLACPVDLVKVQLQGTVSINATHSAIFRGPIDCIVKVIEANGLLGLYRGVLSQACRDIPASGAYFVMYEMCKRKFSVENENSKLACFIAGGIAGMVSWWLILPLDVIKSRIQSDCPHNPQYKGIAHCVRHIFRNEGMVGFFRGFLPLSLRAFPANGATFLIYEYLHTHCRDNLENNYNLLQIA